MLGRRTDGGADVADFLKYENDEPEFETYTPSGARKSGERVIEHARRRNRVYDTVENNEGRARERVHDSVPEVKSTPRSVSEAAERSPKAKSRKRGIGKTLLTIALSAGLAVGGTLYISDQINARKENKEPEGPETKIEEQGLAPSLENNIAVEDETILYGENGADSFVEPTPTPTPTPTPDAPTATPTVAPTPTPTPTSMPTATAAPFYNHNVNAGASAAAFYNGANTYTGAANAEATTPAALPTVGETTEQNQELLEQSAMLRGWKVPEEVLNDAMNGKAEGAEEEGAGLQYGETMENVEERHGEFVELGKMKIGNLKGEVTMFEYHGGYIPEDETYYEESEKKKSPTAYSTPLEGDLYARKIEDWTKKLARSPKAFAAFIMEHDYESVLGIDEFMSMEEAEAWANEIAGMPADEYDTIINKGLSTWYSRVKEAKFNNECGLALDMHDDTESPTGGAQDEIRLFGLYRGNDGQKQVTFVGKLNDGTTGYMTKNDQAYKNVVESARNENLAKGKFSKVAWLNIERGNWEYKLGDKKANTPKMTANPTPVTTEAPTVAPTVAPTPTPEVTPAPTSAPTPGATEAPTPEATATPTVAPTPEVTPTPSATPEATVVPTPTATPEVTPTPTPNITPVATNIPESTPIPVATKNPENEVRGVNTGRDNTVIEATASVEAEQGGPTTEESLNKRPSEVNVVVDNTGSGGENATSAVNQQGEGILNMTGTSEEVATQYAADAAAEQLNESTTAGNEFTAEELAQMRADGF